MWPASGSILRDTIVIEVCGDLQESPATCLYTSEDAAGSSHMSRNQFLYDGRRVDVQ